MHGQRTQQQHTKYHTIDSTREIEEEAINNERISIYTATGNTRTRLRVHMDLIGEIWKRRTRISQSTRRTQTRILQHISIFLPIAVVCSFIKVPKSTSFTSNSFLLLFVFEALPTMAVKQHTP